MEFFLWVANTVIDFVLFIFVIYFIIKALQISRKNECEVKKAEDD